MHVYAYQVVARVPMAGDSDCARLVQCLRGVYNTDACVCCNSLATHSFASFMRSCKRAMNMPGAHDGPVFEAYMPEDIKMHYEQGVVTVSRVTCSLAEVDDEGARSRTRKRSKLEGE